MVWQECGGCTTTSVRVLLSSLCGPHPHLTPPSPHPTHTSPHPTLTPFSVCDYTLGTKLLRINQSICVCACMPREEGGVYTSSRQRAEDEINCVSLSAPIIFFSQTILVCVRVTCEKFPEGQSSLVLLMGHYSVFSLIKLQIIKYIETAWFK